MFKEALEKQDLAIVATMLDRLNPLFEGLQFDPVETTVLALDLSFYPGFQFLDITDHVSMPPLQRYALYSVDQVVVLDFTNEPIYKLNASVPIQLSAENIDDYVRFFFSYVRGQHGRFLIVENVDDIQWREDPPPTARKAIGKMVMPVTLNKTDPDGTYNLTASMTFKGSLFKSDLKITPGGQVTLQNEELLVEDMPLLDDTLGQ